MKLEKIYQTLAESLANLFAPMAEIALYDRSNTMLVIFNRLTQDVIPPIELNQVKPLSINKNQLTKIMIIPLDRGYYLRLIVDITIFKSLQFFLQSYLSNQEKNQETISWQQSIDNLINSHVHQRKTVLSALSPQAKRGLLLQINEKGFLRYQDATKYLANKLGVSRATIYNYLQQASQLKSLQIHQVDAFTDEPFSGNPAGVVLEADNLNDTMMKKIAREMNLSETAFIFDSKKADIKLRFFTPSGNEIKFCGHSTVSALYMLAHSKKLGIDKPGNYKLVLETKIGLIHAEIILDPGLTITIQFQTPTIQLVKSEVKHKQISQVLGIPLAALSCKYPIMFERINQDLYVTVSSLQQLGELQINYKTAKQFAEDHNIVAYVLLCNETIFKTNHIHMRCFAPAVGILEDPFTGSALGGLASYILRNHLIDAQLKMVRVEQGHFIGRPGYVDLQLNVNQSPLVIAKARHFFSTEIML